MALANNDSKFCIFFYHDYMSNKDQRIAAVLMRGGTSKGLFFHAKDLPGDSYDRDRILLSAIGSPDPYGKQIDGLGAATSSTSKVAVIRPSQRDTADIDYLFGHVAIEQGVIDYSGNCGNLSSAVGVFAVEQGLVAPTEPITRVRVWQANLDKAMRIHVPSDGKRAITPGDYEIAGVPGTGAAIRVEFLDPGDGPGGNALPTGNAQDELSIEGMGLVSVSLINAGNPTVIVQPEFLGLTGTELPERINSNLDLLERVEAIRCAASVAMNLCPDLFAAREQAGTPKLACVCAPRPYRATDGTGIRAGQIDVCARIFSMGRLHHAFTGTGAIALAVAAAIPGTLVAECLLKDVPTQTLRIGHSAGVMDAQALMYGDNELGRPRSASILRTARTLMSGHVHLPLPIPGLNKRKSWGGLVYKL